MCSSDLGRLYLEVVEWIHLHDWPDGVQRQGDLDALAGHQWSVNGQGGGGDHSEAARIRNTHDLHGNATALPPSPLKDQFRQ